LPPSFPVTVPEFGGPRTSRIPEGSLFVTGDETCVAVTAVVQYQVADPAGYQLGIDRPEALLRSVTRAALVEVIAQTPIDALYSNARGDVEASVLARLRVSTTVAAMGIRPLSLSLLYVHAPDEVHAAFRDVASAVEDSATTRNKALVEAEGSVRLARGEASRLVVQADSYRIEQVERARGNAAGFVPLAAEDLRAGSITRDRLYLEGMERVLGKVPKLIKPDPRRAPGLEVWVTSSDRGAPVPGSRPADAPPPPPNEEGAPIALPTPFPRR
jgi:modulator of FtsH protease HflK